MLHCVLEQGKDFGALIPLFLLSQMTGHTQCKHQTNSCVPQQQKKHTSTILVWFYLCGSPLKVIFLSSLSVWMTRYSERRLEGEEVIKRNSANLFSFLSLLDNLFICPHLTSCRQPYFPVDRANPSSRVHMCTCTSFPRAFQIHTAKSPWSFGVNRDSFSTHGCEHMKRQCLLPATSLAFQGVSVAMGTQGTFVRTSPPTEVCSFTETQFTSTYIVQFDPSADKLRFVTGTENIF